jgi:tetratricopeptide (TPR) repeat protein
MRNRFFIKLALILLSCAAVISGQEAWANAPLAGKLVNFQGQVDILRGGQTHWQPAQLNDDLFTGDALRTGPLSRAAILCVDESQLKLHENTVLELRSVMASPRLGLAEVIPAALEKAAHSLYSVPQGEVWLRNSKESFRFELETPAVTAGLRGTEFNLKVSPNGTTYLTLLQGSLQLANTFGSLMLNSGEEGITRPGQAPTKRVVIQPEDAVQWALYYPGIFSYRDLPLAAGRAPYSGDQAAGLAATTAAETAYDQGNLPQARQEAETALRTDPQNARALTVLGWVSLQCHELEEAQRYFLRIPDPGDHALIGLALTRYRRGDAAGAYELLKQSRVKARPSPLLNAMCGYFALLVGRVQEAVNLLETIRDQEPVAVLAQSLLAQIFIVQNRKDTARSKAAAALGRNPDSPMARLSMALVEIASFDLPKARHQLEQAIQADPRFVNAYIYLAKIWLGSDYLNRAWQVIERARKIAPQDGEVLNLAGFIRMGYRDYEAAKNLFHQAIRLSPGLGEPHLGMGHYYFRNRDNRQGLAAILTATLLEPRVSVYQSNLGKALYQVRAFDKAMEVYDYAKTLDPKDPTPYLYKGIALTDLYRPGEAIQEFNRSIELNDNLAIFRSRIMLDRDLAVRNYNLARAYVSLGLNDWSLSKALTAVKSDPLNGSAHHFLFSSYIDYPRSFGSAASELLLYRLLSPANQASFIGFEDYTPMFEMPYVRAITVGSIGAWEGRHAIYSSGLDFLGGWPGAAFRFQGLYLYDRGFRPRNANEKTFNSATLVKWDPTVKDSFFGQFSYIDSEGGDNSNLNDFNYQNKPYLRNYYRFRNYELGYAHHFGPQSTFLAYTNYYNFDLTEKDFISNRFTISGQPLRLDQYIEERTPMESVNTQVQHQLILGNHRLIGGFEYFSGHLKYRYRNLLSLYLAGNLVGQDELRLDSRPPDRSYRAYLMDYWQLTPKLIVELGLFFDSARTPQAGMATPISNTQWSPQVGINYQINPQHTIRLVAQRHLLTSVISPRLTPSDVAGFLWQVDALFGTEAREAGLAWEAQWAPKTFSTARVSVLRTASPLLLNESQQISWNWKRYQGLLTANHLLTNSLGLSLGILGKKIDDTLYPTNSLFEFDAYSQLAFLHPRGWKGLLRGTLVHQDFNYRGDSLFGLLDVSFGKEFANKRGQANFTVANVLNRRFFYAPEPIAQDLFFPARSYVFSLAFYF